MKTRKKYRIKSKFRFIVSLIIISVIATSFNIITGLCNSSAITETQYANVAVEYGDTLWAIADDYTPEDTDIRETIYQICKINNIDASELRPGMILKIPVRI